MAVIKQLKLKNDIMSLIIKISSFYNKIYQ